MELVRPDYTPFSPQLQLFQGGSCWSETGGKVLVSLFSIFALFSSRVKLPTGAVCFLFTPLAADKNPEMDERRWVGPRA